MTALGYPALRRLAPALVDPGWLSGLVRYVLEPAILLVVLFSCYRLLHFAMRLRLIERITVLTSLTHLACWRRYRPPKPPRPSH